MKLFLSALALTFAVPAAAQTAPVDHSQHSQAEHARHTAAQGAGHDAHKGHAEGQKHECPMMKDGKKMACCEHKDAKGAKPAGHAAHADHGGH